MQLSVFPLMSIPFFDTEFDFEFSPLELFCGEFVISIVEIDCKFGGYRRTYFDFVPGYTVAVY